MQQNHGIIISFIQMNVERGGSFNNPRIGEHLGTDYGMVPIKFVGNQISYWQGNCTSSSFELSVQLGFSHNTVLSERVEPATFMSMFTGVNDLFCNVINTS